MYVCFVYELGLNFALRFLLAGLKPLYLDACWQSTDWFCAAHLTVTFSRDFGQCVEEHVVCKNCCMQAFFAMYEWHSHGIACVGNCDTALVGCRAGFHLALTGALSADRRYGA